MDNQRANIVLSRLQKVVGEINEQIGWAEKLPLYSPFLKNSIDITDNDIELAKDLLNFLQVTKDKRIGLQSFSLFSDIKDLNLSGTLLSDNIQDKIFELWRVLREIRQYFIICQGATLQEIKDTRRNVLDYFNDTSLTDIVKNNAQGKTGAALAAVFRKYINDNTLNAYPSYGSLVKDWDFPNDKKLENAYRQAKKNKT
jgi:hypothetical protein